MSSKLFVFVLSIAASVWGAEGIAQTTTGKQTNASLNDYELAEQALSELRSGKADTIVFYKRTCVGCCDFYNIIWVKGGKTFLSKIYFDFDDMKTHLVSDLPFETTIIDWLKSDGALLKKHPVKPNQHKLPDGNFSVATLDHYCYRQFSIYMGRDSIITGRICDHDFARYTDYTLASPYMRAFQLAQFYHFSNDADLYGEAHIEYNMQGLLSNKIPGLRQAKWYFILGTNSFYAGNNLYFTEAFVSIDNLGFKIYRVLRLDFLRGWDNSGRTYNGIRIGLLIPALNALRGGGADIEW